MDMITHNRRLLKSDFLLRYHEFSMIIAEFFKRNFYSEFIQDRKIFAETAQLAFKLGNNEPLSLFIDPTGSFAIITGKLQEIRSHEEVRLELYFEDTHDQNYMTKGYSTDGHINLVTNDKTVTIAKAAGLNPDKLFYLSEKGSHPEAAVGIDAAFEEFIKKIVN